MNRRIIVSAVAVLTVSSAAVTAAPAQASSRHCATIYDYHRVHDGQTVRRVGHLLHQRGNILSTSQFSGYRAQLRAYRTCALYGSITVMFQARPGALLRVTDKAGTFIS